MALLNYLKFINRYKKLSRICRARGPGPQMSTRASYGQHSGLSCHLLALLMHNRALRSVTLCDLCPSSSPLREKESLWEFQLLHFRHHSLPWPQGPSARLKIYGQAHWGAAPALPFWILSVFCHKETQEDVSSVDCMWQCLLLSQESEAWWINCQPWRMMFSPYFHYEPGCHLLINFVHWYQFIFYKQRPDVFGKGSDSRSGPAWQRCLHLILESYVGSKDRTWPSALEKKEKKKYKSLCERKRDPWGKFLLSQNKSSLEDYHDIILFLRQPCKARWETPLLVTS